MLLSTLFLFRIGSSDIHLSDLTAGFTPVAYKVLLLQNHAVKNHLFINACGQNRLSKSVHAVLPFKRI